jgi:hypothetical protein
MDHLSALELRLSNERIRLSNAQTDAERELRQVWIKQIEKEIEAERGFNNLDDSESMTEWELLSQLYD